MLKLKWEKVYVRLIRFHKGGNGREMPQIELELVQVSGRRCAAGGGIIRLWCNLCDNYKCGREAVFIVPHNYLC